MASFLQFIFGQKLSLRLGLAHTPVMEKRVEQKILISAARQKLDANRVFLAKLVKDSMLLLEVLSGSYKFKILSLSKEGDIFAVLMDTSESTQGAHIQQLELEEMVRRLAAARHNISVRAIYWRVAHVTAPSSRAQQSVRRSYANTKDSGVPALGDTNYGDLH